MEIGGYFELELRKGKEYHPTALKLNSGRYAFEYILKVKRYKEAYLPYFTCASMLEPIRKLGFPNSINFGYANRLKMIVLTINKCCIKLKISTL